MFSLTISPTISQLRMTAPGDVWHCLETFLVVTIGEVECYWHPVGGGQGYHETSYSAQNGPPSEKHLPQHISSAEVEKPQSTTIPKGIGAARGKK